MKNSDKATYALKKQYFEALPGRPPAWNFNLIPGIPMLFRLAAK